MAPGTAGIHDGENPQRVQAFADLHTSEIDLVLPEKKIALLQLGVFDNGESAQSERARLAGWACHAPSGRMRACG